MDVKDEAKWVRAIEGIRQKEKRLDILVNNAGVIGFSEGFGAQDPENVTLADWNKIHRINSDSVFLGCKYGIALMKQTGGSIINMSSRSGMVGIPGAAAYASSKAGIRNHTKTVALYCAEKDYGIRCNAIAPAAIRTPMWDAMLGVGEAKEAAIKSIEAGCPMNRFGTPDEVAYAAVYLASNASSFITGIDLTIDGGILAGATSDPGKK